jgi:hypothetical protein
MSTNFQLTIVAEFLKTNVNWNKFISLVYSVGNQFNDAQWRFLKAVVLETAIEIFSEKKIKY